MLSFDDTERAFAHKSCSDLKKAYRLFQTFSYPFLVKYGPAWSNVALSIGLPIKGMIKQTIFHQFCGGETIAESSPSALGLYENGIGAILDYSVEGEGSEEDFIRSFEELKQVILEAASKPEYPFAVFKCTGIGSFASLEKVSSGAKLFGDELKKYKEYCNRVDALCKLAYDNNVKLLIDAEDTWIQKAIDDLVYACMVKYNQDKCIVYNTIQMYRKDRLPEIENQIAVAKSGNYFLGLKLVRGAYMENERERAIDQGYPSPIQDTKKDTDDDYNSALELCFENKEIMNVMAGTHNEDSSYLLAKLLTDNNIKIDDDRFWFAQLYGMSDHISFNLAKAGFNVAKYLPYGPVKEVLPYLSRRAQENSSVKGQAGRELTLIQKEIRRRKKLSN
ncbi:proline dehydrogenase family protein [Bacteroidia bacterium]|nr:proline dehydrogenase family protein [Bacteroidia bacterium]